MSSAYSIKRGSATWRQRYEGIGRNKPTVVGEGPVCEHKPDECSVREAWPYPGETPEQFKARLKAKYNWPAMAQEAQTDGN